MGQWYAPKCFLVGSPEKWGKHSCAYFMVKENIQTWPVFRYHVVSLKVKLGIAGFSHLQHSPVGTNGYLASYIFLSQGFCEVQKAVTLSIYLYTRPLVIALKRINFHVVSYCCIIWDKVLIYMVQEYAFQPGTHDCLPRPLKYCDFAGNHHYIPMLDSGELDNNKAPTITAPSQESSASSCGDSTSTARPRLFNLGPHARCPSLPPLSSIPSNAPWTPNWSNTICCTQTWCFPLITENSLNMQTSYCGNSWYCVYGNKDAFSSLFSRLWAAQWVSDVRVMLLYEELHFKC